MKNGAGDVGGERVDEGLVELHERRRVQALVDHRVQRELAAKSL